MNKKSLISFISIEGIFYILFLYLDLTGREPGLSNQIKYSGIVLCFFYALFHTAPDHDKRDLWCVRIGLFFTVLADFNLIFGKRFLLGVLFFLLVQSVYLYRFYTGTSYVIRFLCNVIIALVVCFITRRLNITVDGVLCITSIYFVSLIHNVIIAVQKGNRRTAIGMVLFLLCDINVGLYNASSYLINGSKSLDHMVVIAGILIWLFYLPSQVCLAVSVEKNRM